MILPPPPPSPVLLLGIGVLISMASSMMAVTGSACSKQSAVCSLIGQIRGKIFFDEIQGPGCFHSGNIQVVLDLRGFPLPANNDNNDNGKDGPSQEDMYSLRLKSYGEIQPACSGIGPDFGTGISGGDLGSYYSHDGNLRNDSFYLPQTSTIQGRHSLLGRSVAIYKGPYSNYDKNRILTCCVIGLAMPDPDSNPSANLPSSNQPPGGFTSQPPRPIYNNDNSNNARSNNNNDNNNNYYDNRNNIVNNNKNKNYPNNYPRTINNNNNGNGNNYPRVSKNNNNNINNNNNNVLRNTNNNIFNSNPRDGKFNLIGDYGNSGPSFGLSSSSPFDRQGPGDAFSPMNPGNTGRGNPNGPGRGGYRDIFNTGNNNYNANGEPVFGFSSSSSPPSSSSIPSSQQQQQQPLQQSSYPNSDGYYGRGGRNNYDTGRGQSPTGGSRADNEYYGQGNNNYNNNNYNNNNDDNFNGVGSRGNRNGGFGGSQFPSVFGSIGSADFFNLDGKLAGAAIVNGGANAATKLGGAGSVAGNGNDALASSLGQGFVPPQGPSFKDIYNKPTGESPLSAGGFSDPISPEKPNSLSTLFFGDSSIKETFGLSEEDKFIPRETEDEESSSSFHSNSDSDSKSGDYSEEPTNEYDSSPGSSDPAIGVGSGNDSNDGIDNGNRLTVEELSNDSASQSPGDYAGGDGIGKGNSISVTK